MAKIHWSSEPPGEAGLYVAVCGWLTPTVADRAELVTCLDCQKKLPLEPVDRPSAYVRAVFERRPRDAGLVELEPLEGELPVLSPSSYKRRACTCGAHDCEICHFFARLERERFIRPWLERGRAPRTGGARFGSLSSALRFYLEMLDAGLPLLGSQAAGMLRLGRLGTMVSGGTSSSVLETVDDYLVVEASLRRAFRDYAFGLEVEVCVRTLLLSSVGRRVIQKSGRVVWKAMATDELAAELELEEGKVRAIVRHGRRRVTVDLRGRGILRG